MLGIVVVSYKIPISRLIEHYFWNENLYRSIGAQLFVVGDENYIPKLETYFNYSFNRKLSNLPPTKEIDSLGESFKRYTCKGLVHSFAYPEPMPIFSLAKTKNFGIQKAIEAGCDRIAVTDVDIAWNEETLGKCLEVDNSHAIVPVYCMALDYESRNMFFTIDKGCAGTVAMTAENWQRVRYDERYVGYGGEDGKLRKDIAAVGIHEIRDGYVHHIAHDPTKPQVNVPGAGRVDCWNRDSINPDNWQTNQTLY